MASNGGNVTVQTGFWINWEHGIVRGSTITLDTRDSQILSSFLSAFLTFVGLQLWKIIAYTVHQARASSARVDGLHRQQQLVWKQYTGPAAAAWAFMKQSWAWRKHARRSFLRTIPLSIIGVLYAVGFALLAIFAASEITKTAGGLRLANPTNCGYYNTTRQPTDAAESRLFTIKRVRDQRAASTYADACYPSSSNATSATRCDLHRRSYIAYQSRHLDSCPWPNNICGPASAPYKPYNLDTGLTDSFLTWGINARPDERVQWRRSTTCSPLTQKNYTQVRNVTQQETTVLHQYSNYGRSFGTDNMAYNYSYDYNTNTAFGGSAYALLPLVWDPIDVGVQAWDPIGELKKQDAQIHIFFIAGNGVTSVTPVHDPVFNMSLPLSSAYNAQTNQNETVYTSSSFVGVMACMDQMQFCNPSNGMCTALGSPSALPNATRALGMSLQQLESTSRIFWGIASGGLFAAQTTYGSAASLKASESIDEQTMQNGLPDNQWEREMRGWFETAHARMQQAVLEFATGPANNDPTGNLTLFGRPTAAALCSQQMISLIDGSVNYSVLGLSLTVGLGALIILVSFTLELIVSAVQQGCRIGEHRRAAWILDSGFQLHRQVCQSQGYGGQWYNLEGEVPVCDRNAKFGSDGQAALDDLRTPMSQPESSPFIPANTVPSTAAYNPALYSGGMHHAEAEGKHAHTSVESSES